MDGYIRASGFVLYPYVSVVHWAQQTRRTRLRRLTRTGPAKFDTINGLGNTQESAVPYTSWRLPQVASAASNMSSAVTGTEASPERAIKSGDI